MCSELIKVSTCGGSSSMLSATALTTGIFEATVTTADTDSASGGWARDGWSMTTPLVSIGPNGGTVAKP